MVDGLIDAFLPARCRHCGAPGAALCEGCRARLPWNLRACRHCALPVGAGDCCRDCATAPMFDAARAAFTLAAPIRETVHAMKYDADFGAAALLGDLLAQRLAAGAAPLPEVLLPVPLHPRRLRARGYNQALLLARALTRRLKLELHDEGARCLRVTADQIGQSAAQRRKNLRGAFAIDADLRGRRVALVDDVMTTGATLGELARACRRAGAARVEAWVVARVA